MNKCCGVVKKYFGLTENYREAGYILADGSMLDLSGRHYSVGYKEGKPLPGEPDYLRGQRSVDHRELPEECGRDGVKVMLDFMGGCKIIRFHGSKDSISLNLMNHQLTKEQEEKVREILDNNPQIKEVFVEVEKYKEPESTTTISCGSGAKPDVGEVKREISKCMKKII